MKTMATETWALSLAAVFGASQGCGNSACTLRADTVLSVEIRDAVTQEPICDATIRATKSPGGGSTTFFPTSGPMCGWAGGNAPGEYELEVTRAGYRTAVVPVTVPVEGEGVCARGVHQTVTLELTP